MTPASTRTGDRTEARQTALVLCTSAMASDHTLSREHAPTRWPPRRPADGQQRAALRRGSDGTRSRGLSSPSRRMFSTAPAGVSFPLVPARDTGSPRQLTPCAVSKSSYRHQEAVFPRYCAPQKVKTGSAAAGGHRRVATRKTTGGNPATKGTDPERRAEWMTVSRHGHLQSAPVVVCSDVRTEWEPPALSAALLDSTRVGTTKKMRGGEVLDSAPSPFLVLHTGVSRRSREIAAMF